MWEVTEKGAELLPRCPMLVSSLDVSGMSFERLSHLQTSSSAKTSGSCCGLWGSMSGTLEAPGLQKRSAPLCSESSAADWTRLTSSAGPLASSAAKAVGECKTKNVWCSLQLDSRTLLQSKHFHTDLIWAASSIHSDSILVVMLTNKTLDFKILRYSEKVRSSHIRLDWSGL